MKDMAAHGMKRARGITVERFLLCAIIILQLLILAGPGGWRPGRKTAPACSPPGDSISGGAGKESADDSPRSGAAPPDSAGIPPRIGRFPSVGDHMDQIFEQAMAEFEKMDRFINFDEGWSSLMLSPTLDMRDETDEDEYVVVFGLPGIRESDVTVMLDGRLLTVSCSSEGDSPSGSSFGSFVRSVWLPGPVGDRNQAKATITNGVLRIVIPKGEQQNMAVRDNSVLH